MKLAFLVTVFVFVGDISGQDDDIDGRHHHHKKKRRPAYQQSPCYTGRDLQRDDISEDPSGRSALALAGGAAIAGGALGYLAAKKKYGEQQAVVVNNNIYTNANNPYGSGGDPCGPPLQWASQPPYQGGLVGGLLGSHPILASHLSGGPRGNNIDRTIMRQFNRYIVRPLSHWFR